MNVDGQATLLPMRRLAETTTPQRTVFQARSSFFIEVALSRVGWKGWGSSESALPKADRIASNPDRSPTLRYGGSEWRNCDLWLD